MNKKVKIFKKIFVPIVLLSLIFINLQFPQSSYGANVSRRRAKRAPSQNQQSKKVSQRRPSRFSEKTQKTSTIISVVEVILDSAAEDAGLKSGDIILRMGTNKPTSVKDFVEFVKNAKDGKHILMINRDGKKRRMMVNLPPIGTSPRFGARLTDLGQGSLKQIPVNLELKEATCRVNYTPSNSATGQLEDINVLKYAMIDSDTGRVVFIGSYDPDYPSGPISYYDLLADAIKDPYPSFSLDYKPVDPQMEKAKQIMDKEMRKISTDVEYGCKWMINTMMSILNSTDPIPEKLIFEKRMQQKMGITPEEWKTYLNWDVKSKATTYAQYEMIGSFLGKLFTSLGIEERFGRAFIVFHQAQREVKEDTTNYQTTLKLCDLLQINEDLAQIRSDYNTKRINDETAGRRIFSLYYRTLLKGLGASPSEVDLMANRYRDGYTWDEDLAPALEARYEFLTKEALRLYVFQSFAFSQDFLRTMYPNLPIAYSGTRLYGRPADSPLTRVMFDADYALKYITGINPETLSIPGHLSSLEFLTAEEESKGIPLPEEGATRYWIKPGIVKMESFQDKSGVYFVSADLEIGCEPLFPDRDLRIFTKSLNSYGRGLTKRYDSYARLYPSLHIMREAEKIIAFARWIKKNNISIKIDEFKPVKNPVPEKVIGFFAVAYIVKEKGDMDHFFICKQGGVVFDQEEGEEWIEEEPSEEATSDVMHQLASSTAFAEQAADAALKGNLEGARDLAQKSAQAMTGAIDMGQLPVISNLHPQAITPASDAAYGSQQTGVIPEPPPPTPVSVGTQTVINKEAILALDRNLKANTQARKQIASVKPLRGDSPKEYQDSVSSSRSLEQSSKENLKRLKKLLAHYRNNPVYPQKLIKDLRDLDPLKPVVVKPAYTEEPIVISKKHITSEDTLDIEKATLKKEYLSNELKSLKAEFNETYQVLLRLNKNIQADNALYSEWENEIEAATKRAEDRALNLLEDTLNDRFFDFLKVRFKNTPKNMEQIENFEKIISFKNFNDWANLDQDNWKDIGEKIVSSVENLPLSDKLLSVVKSTRSIIDSGYDITTYFVGWQRIQQGKKNTDAHLLAIQKIAERNKKLNAKIKNIESQLNLRIIKGTHYLIIK